MYGYIVTIQGERITSITHIGPLNPMPATHPSYTEPNG